MVKCIVVGLVSYRVKSRSSHNLNALVWCSELLKISRVGILCVYAYCLIENIFLTTVLITLVISCRKEEPIISINFTRLGGDGGFGYQVAK